MRNWPYAWSLSQKDTSAVKGKVGVAVLPAGGVTGGRHAATLGGWQLAVTKYSKHPAEAVDLLLYLTSREAQKRRAIEASYAPTIPDLYRDRDVLKASPFLGGLSDTLAHAVARPSSAIGMKYDGVSSAIYQTAYLVLSGERSGVDGVRRLEGEIVRARAGGAW